MSLPGKILRWLLVPVSAVAVVALVIVAGRWAVALADARCAVHNMVGGACVEPWHTTVVEAAIYAGVALAAIGLVALPSLLAPTFRRTVAILGLVIALGAVLGLYVLTDWPVLLPLLAIAAAGGGLGLWITWPRRLAHEAG